MKYISIFLISMVIFSSCGNDAFEDNHTAEVIGCNSSKTFVTMKKGFMFDSVPDQLIYYSVTNELTDSCIIYEYAVDSIYSLEDSTMLTGANLGYYNGYTATYHQSLDKSTLKSIHDNGDNISYHENNLDLQDTISFRINDDDYIIYKYEISTPPLDGDLTLFMNEQLGILEFYNQSWGFQNSICEHSRYTEVMISLMNMIKENQNFYLIPLYHHPIDDK